MHVALMFLQPDLRPSSCRDASQRALIVILAHLRLKVNVAQSRPTLCDPMDYVVRGILQARILEWVASPFSRASSQPRNQTQASRIAGGFFTMSHQGSRA